MTAWLIGLAVLAAEPVARPNVLWISAEDISPDLGCYGDRYATTPQIDRLAAKSIRYTRCFTHAGVCAPSRSGLITGMYPPSIGTLHMRCQGVPPVQARCFPEYLRAAGYYCTNNVKTDYQFEAPLTAWDANSNTADWRGRAQGQPFFCVLNFTTTHESQVRVPAGAERRTKLRPEQRHDPAAAPLPAYYADTPVIRQDIANYYDNLSVLDDQVGEVLVRLAADGPADDTIVWFWGDHGRGLPRCKRWLYDSGTQVPLLIHVPEKWRALVSPNHPELAAPGRVCNDLVAFVDFAPTMLNLCGVELPPQFQGQPFLGPNCPAPRTYVYGHRDRMDETYDLIRTVRDQRFRYIRNFRPDLPYGQRISYMDEMPTMRELRRLHAAGELTGPPALFFRATKPVEELYDADADPHQVVNLADDPRQAETLARLRSECERWMLSIGDVGLVPEPILDDWERPSAQWARVEPVGFGFDIQNGQRLATVMPTTPGSSAVYARVASAAKTPDNLKGLAPQLAIGPIPLAADEALLVQAWRIGLRPGPIQRITAAESPSAQAVRDERPDWHARFVASGLLPRLLDLRRADRQPAEVAAKAYRQALGEADPVLRYWGVWGLAWLHQSQQLPDAPFAEFQAIRDRDSQMTVRLAAAAWLARQGDLAASLPLLREQLQSHPQPSGRLQAMHALYDLGEAARPAVHDIRAAQKDGEYVGRVSAAALARLRAESN